MEQVTIGFLHSGTRANFVAPFEALVAQLPAGVRIAEVWCHDDVGVLADGAADLVGNPDVRAIVAAGGPDPALRLKNETEKQGINKPIVFTTVADPVVSGLVKDINKPGNNLTGMAGRTSELDAARLVLLSAFIGGRPGDKFGVLRFETRDHGDDQYSKIVDAANGLGLELKPRKANSVFGIEQAFAYFERQKVKGVVVTADSFFNNHRTDVVAAAKLMPAIYQWEEFVRPAGGLMSFGPSILEAYKMAGEYVARTLNEKTAPGDIPCSEPSAFTIHVNIIMAQKLGLQVPAMLNGQPVRAI